MLDILYTLNKEKSKKSPYKKYKMFPTNKARLKIIWILIYKKEETTKGLLKTQDHFREGIEKCEKAESVSQSKNI